MINMAALMKLATHSHHDIDDLIFEQPLQFFGVFRDDPALGQGGVQVNGMRHDRSAQDAGGQQDAFRAGELGNDRVSQDQAPIGLIQDGFDQVTHRDNTHQRGDDGLDRAEAVPLET
jgi:hypothetical protein